MRRRLGMQAISVDYAKIGASFILLFILCHKEGHRVLIRAPVYLLVKVTSLAGGEIHLAPPSLS